MNNNIRIYAKGADPASDNPLVDTIAADTSYRHRAIMGDDTLTLYYSLPEHVELPLGAFCIFEGERYELMRPESLKMRHSRHFEYTVVLEGAAAKMKLWKFRNPIDGRLRFSLTAKPEEHLQMLVDNLNRRDSSWQSGTTIESAEKVVCYDHTSCHEALQMMASEFKTEYEIIGKTIHLRKVEHNRETPLPLSYGRGKGFKPGVGRSNYSDTPPIEILYAQGGERNINPYSYGSPTLLLPAGETIGYDGEHFSDEQGYDTTEGRTYQVSADGLSLHRVGVPFQSYVEESLDCSDHYPYREGTVTGVTTVEEERHLYDFTDNTIEAELDYEDYIIEGETLAIIFQSGQLSGKEFEAKYIHAERRFEVKPEQIDGVWMPSETFPIQAGNKYIVFNCSLPDAYIRNDHLKSGASWDMFREAVKYKYDNEEPRFSFTGELDGIWAKKDWANIGAKIILGGYVLFSDERFQSEGIKVRIIGIKDYINNHHSPEIELSNATVSGGFSTTLKMIEGNEIVAEEETKRAVQFTKRRFRDTLETMSMLEQSLLNFSEAVNPITVKTMQALVGDESLQFRFINNTSNHQKVNHNITFDAQTKRLDAAPGTIQHLTLGITDLSSSRQPSEYRYWTMGGYESAALNDPTKRYYLYARVSRNSGGSTNIGVGEFILSEGAIAMEQESGYYHLLVGILNSEYEGDRSFVPLYGYTEILPGRITTDRIVSGDGESFFDMVANAMKLGDCLDFNSQGDGVLRIKGSIVQNPGGEEAPIGVFRGQYNSSHTYYNGDEVTYILNGVTSTYRCISPVQVRNIPPTDATRWSVIAAGVKGEDGADGADGVPGTNGQFTEYRYAVNGSKTTPPYLGSRYARNPGGWDIYQPAVGELQYLWMINTVITPTLSGEVVATGWSTPVRMNSYDGRDGTNGVNGTNGSDGHSVKSVDVQYAIGNANGVTGGWNTTAPTNLQQGQYIWSRTKTVIWDGIEDTTSYTQAARISGADGADGRGISSIVEWYYMSTSPTSLMGGSWSTTAPTWQNGKYIWTKSKITYSDGSTSETAPINATGAKGDNGEPGGRGVSPVFRGVWSETKTYEGNSLRCDVVKYGNAYYIASIDAGTISGAQKNPANGQYWNNFGANFDSIATGLLLAEWANIAGFIFKGNKLWSQWGMVGSSTSQDPSASGFVPNIEIDGINGVIKGGGNMEIRRDGMEISNPGNTSIRTIVRNQTIAAMVSSLQTYGDSGSVTLPTTNNQGTSMSLTSGQSYSLIINGLAMFTNNVTPTPQGDMDLYAYCEMFLIRGTSETKIAGGEILIYSNQDGVAQYGSHSDYIKLSGQTTFSAQSSNSVRVKMGVRMDGYGNYSGSLSWSVSGHAEYWKQGRQWTLIGSDGIFVAKGAAEFKVINSGSNLEVTAKGLPNTRPGTRGLLYVDGDGSIKVS